MSAEQARALLAEGQPAAALKALQQAVRGSAADVKLRIFLFQLLCVIGQWARAADQLKVCGELDASTLAMVNTYGAALACETAREAVFAGRAAPHLFGPPTPWVAQLAQALQLDAAGHGTKAAEARRRAFDEAPASSGTLDGVPFAWLADADSRLGPVLEVVINGRYGWLPLPQLSRLEIEPVADLRDLVWAAAQLTFVNGAQTVALLPVRYPGTAAGDDAALQMARRTEWLVLAGSGPGGDAPGAPATPAPQPAPGEAAAAEHAQEPPHERQYRGLGQRMLSTDRGDHGLLDLRSLTLDVVAAG